MHRSQSHEGGGIIFGMYTKETPAGASERLRRRPPVGKRGQSTHRCLCWMLSAGPSAAWWRAAAARPGSARSASAQSFAGFGGCRRSAGTPAAASSAASAWACRWPALSPSWHSKTFGAPCRGCPERLGRAVASGADKDAVQAHPGLVRVRGRARALDVGGGAPHVPRRLQLLRTANDVAHFFLLQVNRAAGAAPGRKAMVLVPCVRRRTGTPPPARGERTNAVCVVSTQCSRVQTTRIKAQPQRRRRSLPRQQQPQPKRDRRASHAPGAAPARRVQQHGPVVGADRPPLRPRELHDQLGRPGVLLGHQFGIVRFADLEQRLQAPAPMKLTDRSSFAAPSMHQLSNIDASKSIP